jgi:hypothetical protein
VLVEWLKVKALSSSPSTAKRKKKKLSYLSQIIWLARAMNVWVLTE